MARRNIANIRVLVTGASGGIGREIALELARQGANLVLVARREEPLKSLADEITQIGRQAHVVVGDITLPDVRQASLDCAQESLGGLDILVNNAGVGALGPFAEAGEERLRRIMEVNFFTLAEMTRAAIPLLKAGNRPMVVQIGSILGHRALPRSSEYCASKFAVRGLAESLRAELAPLGIDVLLVSPATTETEFTENLLERRGPPAFRAARGTPAAVVARRTAAAIRRGRHELFPDLRSRFIHCANRLLPGLMEWWIMRGERRR
ncbi:MAG: SDR family NAD(P)-dependent oxidoreductase [Pirellulales bacterium]